MTFRSVFHGIYYAFAYINGGGMCQIGSETTLCINVTVWRISTRKQRMYSLNLWFFYCPIWLEESAQAGRNTGVNCKALTSHTDQNISIDPSWRAPPMNMLCISIK